MLPYIDGPPGAPGAPTIERGDRELTVSWTPPEDNGTAPVKGYLLEWRKDGRDYAKEDRFAPPHTWLTYTIDNLANGTTYQVRVTAWNASGHGTPSEETSAAPGSGPAKGLATPSLHTPETVGHRRVKLDWDDVDGADSYDVHFYDWDTRDWVILPTTDVAVTFDGSSAVVGGLPEGRLWFLKVRAVNSGGVSEWSEAVQIFPTKASDWDGESANSPATGLPAISGTAQVGEPLTADTSGISDADGLDNAEFSYQWIRNDGTTGADIPDATASTYSPSDGDVGTTIKVRVTFTDDANNQESRTSPATAAVAATVPAKPLGFTLSRGSQIQELDASWQAPSSNGGTAVTGYKVQWKEAAGSWDTEADVSEEAVTGTTYTITGLTGGVEYAVRVIATNDVGHGPASAEATGTPAGGASKQNTEPENSDPTGLPAISGTAQAGQLLTADTTGIDDADGLTSPSYSYQWIRSDGNRDTDIQDATGSTYELTDDDVGTTIRVRVSFTDDADDQETLTSEATNAVAARPNSPATGAPIIGGIAQVDQPLAADTSGISDQDGLTGVAYTYQWLADDAEIQGATDSTYTLTDGQVGKTIMVRVSFTDEAGHAESLVSQATSAVAAAPSPLTASAHGVPGSHDGQTAFTFELRFSEEPHADFSFRTLRDHAFTVTGGTVTRARRLEKPSNVKWQIHVRPDSTADVIVLLPVTTDCGALGAVCTADGRMLTSRVEFSVKGTG